MSTEAPPAAPPVTPPATPPAAPPAAPPPQTPPSAPWHQSILTEDGKFAPNWHQQLPESMADFRAMAAQYQDLGALLKSHRDSMTAARSKGLRIPGENATDEERQAFQTELRRLTGAPDSPDAYEIPAPEGLPQGLDWKQETAAFRETAHKLGLNPDQAKAIVEFDMQRQQQAQQQLEQQRQQLIADEQAEMRKRWGDKADQALNEAARVGVAANLPSEMFDPQSPMFVGVQIADAFRTLSQRLGEHRHVVAPSNSFMDPVSLAKDIMGNPNNPDYKAYNDSSHPNSAAVRARVAQLYKQADGKA